DPPFRESRNTVLAWAGRRGDRVGAEKPWRPFCFARLPTFGDLSYRLIPSCRVRIPAWGTYGPKWIGRRSRSRAMGSGVDGAQATKSIANRVIARNQRRQ